MRRRLFILALLAASLCASAQRPDVIDQLRQHPEYLAGTDYLCPTGPVALSPAPKGYKPFYISHYVACHAAGNDRPFAAGKDGRIAHHADNTA